MVDGKWCYSLVSNQNLVCDKLESMLGVGLEVEGARFLPKCWEFSKTSSWGVKSIFHFLGSN